MSTSPFTVKNNEKKITTQTFKGPQQCLVFLSDDPIKGSVRVNPKDKKIEHNGIKVDMIGEIEVVYDRGSHHEFMSLTQTLCAPGVLASETSFDLILVPLLRRFTNLIMVLMSDSGTFFG